MTEVVGAGLALDTSYQRIDSGELLDRIKLPLDFADTKQKLLKGDFINKSEQRRVTHVLCRSSHSVVGSAERPSRFDDIVKRVRGGAWRGATGKSISTVVNVGVGGSDLGPRLATEALAEFCNDSQSIDVHFVSSMDGAQLYSLFKVIDPETTLFILASKSFSTIDTFANIKTIKSWCASVMSHSQWLAHHVIGVSSSAAKMTDYGIPVAHQVTFGEGVGGRFSLWSAIGLPIALKCGLSVFKKMLEGARAMDKHFLEAPDTENLPLLMALYGIYNRSELGINNLVILPYDGRLAMLPDYLQQLDMESNGKQVTADGNALDIPTGPIVWGGFGPNGQHAFYQHLHQGYDEFAADFIMVFRRDGIAFSDDVAKNLAEQQQLAVANCLAHRQLMFNGSPNGRSSREHYVGGHPSNLIVIDELSPEKFGALIAAYEHKIFVQGVYWGLNSFDQPGVEKGKKIAVKLMEALTDSNVSEEFDQSTSRMIKKFNELCG
ncbi:glucose-6-phosphate isomerase [Idiomarina aquatica]|uniref:Glucose-6-phosphate isomerase n=1 Tax=Idiomarina aquatica TaxID=1327752 RepID=A0AA94EG31_9GAMM|nr:glucose-6-phosphate isomerase [Idiomarina aquatica]RUO45187.1 glucose-6-phosphate isomerase [Idiomarina aquatica]